MFREHAPALESLSTCVETAPGRLDAAVLYVRFPDASMVTLWRIMARPGTHDGSAMMAPRVQAEAARIGLRLKQAWVGTEEVRIRRTAGPLRLRPHRPPPPSRVAPLDSIPAELIRTWPRGCRLRSDRNAPYWRSGRVFFKRGSQETRNIVLDSAIRKSLDLAFLGSWLPR